MVKKLIRLTESDLHNLVKEAVNKILNEVQYGGESLHGNKAEDWEALAHVRSQRAYNKNSNSEAEKALKNRNNANELEYDSNKNFQPYYRSGGHKGDRIIKNKKQ